MYWSRIEKTNYTLFSNSAIFENHWFTDWKPQSVVLTWWEGRGLSSDASAYRRRLVYTDVGVDASGLGTPRVTNWPSRRWLCVYGALRTWFIYVFVGRNSLKINKINALCGSAHETMAAADAFLDSGVHYPSAWRRTLCALRRSTVIRLGRSSSIADVRPVPSVLKNNLRKTRRIAPGSPSTIARDVRM